MTHRELFEQALKALETNNQAWKHLADSGDAGFLDVEEQPFYETSVKAITALRAALAEPVQEPVAYWNADESSLAFKPGRSGMWVPLYANPKPCPTCVSLARAVMMDQMGSD